MNLSECGEANCFTVFARNIKQTYLKDEKFGQCAVIGFLNNSKDDFSQIILWRDVFFTTDGKRYFSPVDGGDPITLINVLFWCDLDN